MNFNIRGLLAALVGFGLVVLVVVLLIKAFTGGGSSKPAGITDLTHYASTNAVAELYIDAPINLNQDHRTIKISVDQTETQIQVMQGYDGDVTKQQTFPNSQSGFAVFLRALQLQNFAKGNSDPAQADERGACPLGDRYIYQFVTGGETKFRYWSTSCGGGTFQGNNSNVRTLFTRQVNQQVFDQFTGSIPLGF